MISNALPSTRRRDTHERIHRRFGFCFIRHVDARDCVSDKTNPSARVRSGVLLRSRARSSASLTRHANPERRRRRRIDHRDDMITPTTTMTTGNRRAQRQHDGTKRKGRTCTSNSLSSNLSRFVCNASRSSAPSVLYLAQTSRDGGVPSGA